MDPDPDFYLNADPNRGSQSNVDPCGFGSGLCRHKKLNFYMKLYFMAALRIQDSGSGAFLTPRVKNQDPVPG
jgi:hypothetical protein